MIFSRAEPLPSDVRQRAGLSARERVLAWTGEQAHGWLVATKEALVIVGAGEVIHLGWDEVERASWDRDTESLRIVEVGTFGAPRVTHQVSVAAPGDFLAVLRERVTSTLVLQSPGMTPDGRAFTVVVRRSPRDRSVRALVEYDAATDPEDPAVVAAVEEALRQVSWEIAADL